MDDALVRYNPDSIDHVRIESQRILAEVTEGKLHDVILSMPEDLVMMEEKNLRKLVNPTPALWLLRINFWREYDRCMARADRKMSVANIVEGVISPSYFNSIANEPYKVAWIIKPPLKFEMEIDALIARGVERYWEIVDLPIMEKTADGKSKYNTKHCEIILKAMKELTDRAKGLAIQKIESKSLNVELTNDTYKAGEVDALDARIKQLEKDLGKGVIDVREDSTTETRICGASGDKKEA